MQEVVPFPSFALASVAVTTWGCTPALKQLGALHPDPDPDPILLASPSCREIVDKGILLDDLEGAATSSPTDTPLSDGQLLDSWYR